MSDGDDGRRAVCRRIVGLDSVQPVDAPEKKLTCAVAEDRPGVEFIALQAVPDIAYFFGWKAAEDPSYHYLIGPRAELKSGGLDIVTINSHYSGVPEAAWLVKVERLVIYHNGDCQPGDPASEYDFLKTKAGRIGLAFVPPVYEDRYRYAAQNLDLFQKFSPRAVFPMHAQAGDSKYVEFKKTYKAKISGLPVFIPRRMGDRFDVARKRSSEL